MRKSAQGLGCVLVLFLATYALAQEPGQTVQVFAATDESRIVERVVKVGPLRSLKIHDLKEGRFPPETPPRIELCERSLEFNDVLSPDGRYLAYSADAGNDKYELCVINLARMRVVRRTTEMGLPFLFLPSGDELIAAETERFVRVGADELRILAEHDAPGEEFTDFFPLPDGKHLAVASQDLPEDESGTWDPAPRPRLQLFRLPDLLPVGEPVPLPSAVASMGATPSGDLLVLLDGQDNSRLRPNLFRRTDLVFETRSVPDLKLRETFSIRPGQRHRSFPDQKPLTFVDDGRHLLWSHYCPLLVDWKTRTLVGYQPGIPDQSVFFPRSRRLLMFDPVRGRLEPAVAIADWPALFRGDGPPSALLPAVSEDAKRQREQELKQRQKAVNQFHKRAKIDGNATEWDTLATASEEWLDPLASWIPPELQPLWCRFGADRGTAEARFGDQELTPFYLEELAVLPGPEGFSILIRPDDDPDPARPNAYYLGLDLPHGDSEDIQIQLSGTGRHRFFVNDRGTLQFPEPVPIEVAFGEVIEVRLPYDSIRRLLPELEEGSAPLDCELTAFTMVRSRVRTALSAMDLAPRIPARGAAKTK